LNHACSQGICHLIDHQAIELAPDSSHRAQAARQQTTLRAGNGVETPLARAAARCFESWHKRNLYGGSWELDIIGNKLLGSRKEAKAIVIDEIASRIDFFSYFRLSLF
jgi:hypothetical protein